MNFITKINPKDFKTSNGDKKIFEIDVDYWEKSQCCFLKIQIQITLTPDHQIIYQKNAEILRIQQVQDNLETSEFFKNMDQIRNLSWNRQNGQNKKKDGKWIASWDKKILNNIGGYYINGFKHGLWNDLFLNYWNQAQVREIGEYYQNLKINNWNYIFKDKKIGGGFYNNIGQKQGKWIELDERFCKSKQVTYNGEYNINGVKIGAWDIMYCKPYGDEKHQMQI